MQAPLANVPSMLSGDFFLPPVQEESWSRLLYVVEQQRRLAVLTGAAEVGKTHLLQGIAAHAGCRQTFWLDGTGLAVDEFAGRIAEACYGVTEADSLWSNVEDWLWGSSTCGTPSLWIIDHAGQGLDELSLPIRRLVRLMEQTHAPASVLVAARDWSQVATLEDVADLWSEVPAWDLLATDAYVERHRPATGRGIHFSSAAVQGIYDCTHGVAGRVRRLCDVCVLAAQLREESIVDIDAVLEVWSELVGPGARHRGHSRDRAER